MAPATPATAAAPAAAALRPSRASAPLARAPNPMTDAAARMAIFFILFSLERLKGRPGFVHEELIAKVNVAAIGCSPQLRNGRQGHLESTKNISKASRSLC